MKGHATKEHATKETLTVLMGSRQAGTLTREHGHLSLRYDEDYRTSPAAVPLSRSLPLTEAVHDHETVAAWLWGLLPDKPAVLETWARRFAVRATDVFALLGTVGTDCAGAVRFVAPERLDRVDVAGDGNDVLWLSTAELADRLAELRRGGGDARRPGDPGAFTLAGAQPKTALVYDNGRWGVPGPTTPSNVIVKPVNERAVPGLIENEHFCLRLAGAAGLPVARSALVQLGPERVLVVERFDRRPAGPFRWVRRHQEDACQALSVHPDRKYQSDGGPGIDDLMGLLGASADPDRDRRTFVRALLFNFLIAGTDAHAKNYAIRLGRRGTLRLAPLYDIASFLPYASDYKRIKLAMKVGRRYHLANTYPRHWVRRAEAAGYPADVLVADLQDMARALPDRASDLAARLSEEGISHPVLPELVDAIAGHCDRMLGRVGAFFATRQGPPLAGPRAGPVR